MGRPYCGTCGTYLGNGGIECPVCAARAAAAVAQPDLSVQAEAGSIRSVLVFYFTLLATVLLGGIVQAVDTDKRHEVLIDLSVQLVMSAITLVFCVLHWRVGVALLRGFAGFKWYLFAVLCPFVTVAGAEAFFAALGLMGDFQVIRYLDSFDAAGWSFLSAVLLIGVFPAVTEELAFRGVVLGVLEGLMESRSAILASAGMFSILHLSAVNIPHTFILGLVLAWLRLSTKSLYPGMLLHFLHNLFVISLEKMGEGSSWLSNMSL